VRRAYAPESVAVLLRYTVTVYPFIEAYVRAAWETTSSSSELSSEKPCAGIEAVPLAVKVPILSGNCFAASLSVGPALADSVETDSIREAKTKKVVETNGRNAHPNRIDSILLRTRKPPDVPKRIKFRESSINTLLPAAQLAQKQVGVMARAVDVP